MAKNILLPLPSEGFDPTEVAVPWRRLSLEGHRVVFATPNGAAAHADPVMVTGKTLGPLKYFLRADRNGRDAYQALEMSPAFRKPIAYAHIDPKDFDALLLPGGHAAGVKEIIESPIIHLVTRNFFSTNKPIGAICHGVLIAARTIDPVTKRSILHHKRTTALPRWMETLAHTITRAFKGNYYKTYPIAVQDEVEDVLIDRNNFIRGPISFSRDASDALGHGFVVRDGNYLSARWPGDAHVFAETLVTMLQEERPERKAKS